METKLRQLSAFMARPLYQRLVLLAEVRHFVRMPLPVLPVERLEPYRRTGLQAACVDIVSVGVRARYVEGLDPAGAAKVVLGDAGIEGVGLKRILTGQEPELRARHDQVPMTGKGADRAIAVVTNERLRRLDLE